MGTPRTMLGTDPTGSLLDPEHRPALRAPRGMTFLYDPHRLNVATSRARCACILVAAPRLLEPDCRTPAQMSRANGFCRFRELAREVL